MYELARRNVIDFIDIFMPRILKEKPKHTA